MKQLSFLLLFVFLFSFPTRADFLDKKTVKLGEEVPDFTLTDLEGKEHSLSSYKGKVVMIHFWSATCPFVARYSERLKQISEDYTPKGVTVLAIDSNSNEAPDQMKKVAIEREVNYPILVDPANKIADEFGAITTPHVFILDKDGKLAYEGAVDDQGYAEHNKISNSYVRDALDSILAGTPVEKPQTKTVGCTVKRVF